MSGANATFSKANSLILITNHYPFGLAESFLEHEIIHLSEAFDRVIVLARDVTSTGTRPLPANVEAIRINPESDIKEVLLTLAQCFWHLPTLMRYTMTELAWIRLHKKRISTHMVTTLMHDLVKAVTTSHHLVRTIQARQLTGKITLYSYWLTSSALATTLVESKQAFIKKVSRAHGGDVYENRHRDQYLSFRGALLRHLDRIFTISENGAEHLRSQLPAYEHKVNVSRLGTPHGGVQPQKTRSNFTLVSCSFTVPVKRINLIIEALSKIDYLCIDWIHIGGGPLDEKMKHLASQLLGRKENIAFTFAGAMSNADVLAFYRQRYVDLFINTSESEGVPVTIMEAQSFGIPTLAPAVGGIPEIVTQQNGRLFDVGSDAATVARHIERILVLPSAEYEDLRHHSLQNWAARYDAGKNFSTFARELASL